MRVKWRNAASSTCGDVDGAVSSAPGDLERERCTGVSAQQRRRRRHSSVRSHRADALGRGAQGPAVPGALACSRRAHFRNSRASCSRGKRTPSGACPCSVETQGRDGSASCVAFPERAANEPPLAPGARQRFKRPRERERETIMMMMSRAAALRRVAVCCRRLNRRAREIASAFPRLFFCPLEREQIRARVRVQRGARTRSRGARQQRRARRGRNGVNGSRYAQHVRAGARSAAAEREGLVSARGRCLAASADDSRARRDVTSARRRWRNAPSRSRTRGERGPLGNSGDAAAAAGNGAGTRPIELCRDAAC